MLFCAILRDEYLTAAVGTKEGDKASSNQPPARDPVQFKLELTPNYLISYLENTGSRSTRYVSMLHRMRAQSFQNFSRKAILKLQDHLSQHDRCKSLNQRHLRYACRFKSTNQRIGTKQTSLSGAGLWFWTANGRDTLIGGFESTRIPQMPLVEIFAPVMLNSAFWNKL